MSKYTVIANPAAGRGSALRFIPTLQRYLNKRGIDFELVQTRGPGEATTLARNAPGPCVVAFGGDGTVNEIANGLVGTSKILGVLPAGSGNDLVKSINIPRQLSLALNTLLEGKSRPIDVATVSCGKNSETLAKIGNSTPRYFVNGVGIGFDAAVAERTRHVRFLTGSLLYLVAVFQTLGKYRAPNFQVTVDSNPMVSKHLLIAIGNGVCAGGGFYLTPRAVIDDGFLDVCLIGDIPISQVLRLMPKVMKGKHGTSEWVQMCRGRTVHVHADDDVFVHADGEIVGRNVNTIDVRIVEKALNVIVG